MVAPKQILTHPNEFGPPQKSGYFDASLGPNRGRTHLCPPYEKSSERVCTCTGKTFIKKTIVKTVLKKLKAYC